MAHLSFLIIFHGFLGFIILGLLFPG